MNRDGYDVMQVCLNGHKITDIYQADPATRQNACGRCGAKTIHQCPDCGADIKGADMTVLSASGANIPDYCKDCGEPYPWTDEVDEYSSDNNISSSNESVSPQISSSYIPEEGAEEAVPLGHLDRGVVEEIAGLEEADDLDEFEEQTKCEDQGKGCEHDESFKEVVVIPKSGGANLMGSGLNAGTGKI